MTIVVAFDMTASIAARWKLHGRPSRGRGTGGRGTGRSSYAHLSETSPSTSSDPGPLSHEELQTLRHLMSRADISSTTVSNPPSFSSIFAHLGNSSIALSVSSSSP